MIDDPRPRLAAPSEAAWQRLGLEVGLELSGGHQSRVFAASLGTERVVVKLTEPSAVDRRHHEARLRVLVELADSDGAVVGPLLVRGAHHHVIGAWRAVVYPDAGRIEPDIDRRDDVTAMANGLAALHRSMACLPHHDLPAVAALRGSTRPDHSPPSGQQLIHGDFAASNVRLEDGRVRVLDFDDCGYGNVEFELGNSLYMVLFDATVRGELDRYRRFREWFVDAYVAAAGTAFADVVLDRMIELRRAALRGWLDDPAGAPIGVRSASPDWRRTLRAFADG